MAPAVGGAQSRRKSPRAPGRRGSSNSFAFPRDELINESSDPVVRMDTLSASMSAKSTPTHLVYLDTTSSSVTTASNEHIYEWLCNQWETCDPQSPRPQGGGSPKSKDRDNAPSELTSPVTVALSCGMPSSMGQKTTRTGDVALRMLEESRKQRAQQDVLLLQADKLQERAKKMQPKGEVMRRVGGAPSTSEAPSIRALCQNHGGELPFGTASSSSHDQAPDNGVKKAAVAAKKKIATAAFRRLASPTAPNSPTSGSSTGDGTNRSSASGSFSFFPSGRVLPQRNQSPQPCRSPRASFSKPASPVEDDPLPSKSEEVISIGASLLDRGLVSITAQPWDRDFSLAQDDLDHVHKLFMTQLPGVEVLGVFRVQNANLTSVYEAIKGTMVGPGARELDLWHGTTVECARNIVLGGFNRAYSGRHGMKFGQGTYFSSTARYSLRFCGGRQYSGRRVMLLARVLVGESVKGTPDLVEPPYRDDEQMTRYDSTVDDEASPNIFCIFRDYQAVAQYLIEFAKAA